MSTGVLRRHAGTAAVVVALVAVGVLAVARVDLRASRADPIRGYDASGRPLGRVIVPDARPNLVVVVLDTLRADCLDPERMPFLSRLAAEGVSFRNACSTAPWTLPSATSILTGLLPTDHGNIDQRQPVLPPDVTTYAEVLAKTCGYETLACVAGPWFGDRNAALQGFEHVATDFHLQGIDGFLRSWAERRDPKRPFFLYLHSYEAHDPYGAKNHPWPRPNLVPGEGIPALPLEPWEVTRTFYLDYIAREGLARVMGPDFFVRSTVKYVTHDWAEDPHPGLVDELRDAYHGGIRWVDGQLERAVGSLRAWRLLDDTVLVVLGDHGEGFGEHGQIGHGHQLYDELVHVPVVMHGPGPFRGGRVVSGSVSAMDVLPTFLDWVGVPPLTGVSATSMLPVLDGGPGRPVLAEELLTPITTQQPIDASRTSVRTDRWKYVATYDRSAGVLLEELYDLAADAGESRNLLAGGAAAPKVPTVFCRAMREARERLSRTVPVPPSAESEAHGSGVPQATATAAVSALGAPGPCD